MKRKGLALLLAALLVLLAACGSSSGSVISSAEDTLALIEDSPSLQILEPESSEASAQEAFELPVTEASVEPEAADTDPAEEPAAIPDEEPVDEPADALPEEAPADAPEEPQAATVSEDGEYTAPEDVAAYIHEFGHLPSNFITKSEARDLGWDNSRGNLWDVAPGKSIGGDRFGNYEGLLPDDTKYKECDVNYTGGYRGAERLIFGENGCVYYTNDHYSSFTRLY